MKKCVLAYDVFYVMTEFTFAPSVPVGGFWIRVNKTELLAPWITLASLITVGTVSIIYVKHRKK